MKQHLRSYRLFESAFQEVLYHGTDKTFDEFKLGMPTKNDTYNTISDNGIGVFFTDNLIMAKWFAGLVDYNPKEDRYENTGKAGRVIEARIHLDNPYVIEGVDPNNDEDGAHEYFTQIERFKDPGKNSKTIWLIRDMTA